MAETDLHHVLLHLHRAAPGAGEEPASDADLLERFLGGHDEGAFAVLLRRHGPMVLGVCRRVLGHAQDAEDACQAAFLVLVRKGATIRNRSSLAGWLHGVAWWVARELRRRKKRAVSLAGDGPAAPPEGGDLSWREVHDALDEELGRLPERLRAPLVLCYLEGQTRDEAAARLGWTTGTLRGRLQRGRETLRRRLARRGLDLGALLLAGGLAGSASAGLPARLFAKSLRTAGGEVSPPVNLIANSVARAMTMARWQRTAVFFSTLAVLGLAGLLLAYQAFAGTTPPVRSGANAPVAAQPAAVAKEQPQRQTPQKEKEPAPKGKTQPAGVALEARLVGMKEAYTLDLGGASEEEFLKQVEAGKGKQLPDPPTVDLFLDIRNTSDKEVTIWIGGDETRLELELKGPGAHSINTMYAFTSELRFAKRVVLGPNSSTNVPVAKLAWGTRMAERFAYWTRPGDYTLTATYRTAVSPAPRGADDAGNGFGTVTLTSAPVTLTVRGKQ
jgi:RNA polymerase sigma factor (sigma-70 family)